MPAIPPPMTSARLTTGLSIEVSGVFSATFATAALPRIIAFSVVVAMSLCIHEHCSRIFATSTRYGFRPTEAAAFLNVFSCILGEHEHITTPVSFCSLMALLTSS